MVPTVQTYDSHFLGPQHAGVVEGVVGGGREAASRKTGHHQGIRHSSFKKTSAFNNPSLSLSPERGETFAANTEQNNKELNALPSSKKVPGNLGYDFVNEMVTVHYSSYGDIPTLAHELKHAYQYETRQIDLVARSDGASGGWAAYDLFDEQESMARSDLFRNPRGSSSLDEPVPLSWAQQRYPDIKDRTTQISIDNPRSIYERYRVRHEGYNAGLRSEGSPTLDKYRYMGWQLDRMRGQEEQPEINKRDRTG